MTTPSLLSRHAAAVQSQQALPLEPVSEQQRERLELQLNSLRANLRSILDVGDDESIPALAPISSPSAEQISEHAWDTARFFELRTALIRAFAGKDGSEIAKETITTSVLSGCELLAENALGFRDGCSASGGSCELGRIAVEQSCINVQKFADAIDAPIEFSRSELRSQRAMELRAQRAERAKPKEQRMAEALPVGTHTEVRATLERSTEISKVSSTVQRARVETNIEWAHFTSPQRAPDARFEQRVILAAATLSAVAGAAMTLLQTGRLSHLALVAFTASATVAAIIFAQRLAARLARPASLQLYRPSIQENLKQSVLGSYTSKDKEFTRSMGIQNASVYLPALAQLVPVEQWLTLLPKIYPNADDLPRHGDFFIPKSVPGQHVPPELQDSATELRIERGKTASGLPLNPAYEITSLIFRTKDGAQLPSGEVRVEEGVLGSFNILSAIPEKAETIEYRIRLKPPTQLSPEFIEKVKKYLPLQPALGTTELDVQRDAVISLYPDDGTRATRWIENLRAHGYHYCDDPALNTTLRNFGVLWNPAFFIHRLGNCSHLATHATAELNALGTAAFFVGGLAPDQEKREFRTSLSHAQSMVLTTSGPKSFDLTIGSKKVGGIDLSKLSRQDLRAVQSESLPADPAEAFHRATLLKSVIVERDANATPQTEYHSFRDNSDPNIKLPRAQALQYISQVLAFKRVLESLKESNFENAAEVFLSPNFVQLVSLEPPDAEEGPDLPDLNPLVWPRPKDLFLAAVQEALRSDVLAPDKKQAVVFLFSQLTSGSTQMVEKVSFSGVSRAESEKLLEELKAVRSPEDLARLVGSVQMQVERQEREIPRIYSSSELIHTIPTAILHDSVITVTPSILNFVGAAAAGAYLCMRNYDRWYPDPKGQASETPVLEVCRNIPEASPKEILEVFEFTEAAIKELNGRPAPPSGTFEAIRVVAASVLAANGVFHRRFADAAPDSAVAAIKSRIDDLTANILVECARNLNCPAAYAPLCGIASPLDLTVDIIEGHELYREYLQRQGDKFAALKNGGDSPLQIWGDSISRILDMRLPPRKSPREVIADWRAVLESSTGPLPPQVAHDLQVTFTESVRNLKFFPTKLLSSGSAGNLFRQLHLNFETHTVCTFEGLSEHGFIDDILLANLPTQPDQEAARELSEKLTFTVKRGAPWITAQPDCPKIFSLLLVRVPWLTSTVFESNDTLSGYCDAAQVLGGINTEAEDGFIAFEAEHPHEARALRARLTSQFGIVTRINDDALDGVVSQALGQAPGSASISAAEYEKFQFGLKLSIVRNAYRDISQPEIYYSIRWLIALRHERPLEPASELYSLAESVVSEVLRTSRTHGDSPVSKLSEHEQEKILAKFGLNARPEDTGLPPLSAGAKLAALLTFAQYYPEFGRNDVATFMELGSVLGIQPIVFEPLTRSPDQTSSSLRSRMRRAILNSADSPSILTREDLRRAEIRSLSSEVTRIGQTRLKFPEFYDIVTRGRQSPPGESGLYASTRPYTPGTSVRQIDWKSSARTDKLIVRDRVEEVEPPSIACVDLEAFYDATIGRAARRPDGKVSERERDFSLLLGELRDISRNKTQGAIVAYSDGAPVCILLSAHSRLKSVFSANPETASLIKYVSGFTSAGALNELGKLISASAKIQSIDNLTPGVWRFPAPELSLDWLKKKPQGLRLRILSTKEQLRRSASALSRMHSTLKQTGGELEVIPVGPNDQD